MNLISLVVASQREEHEVDGQLSSLDALPLSSGEFPHRMIETMGKPDFAEDLPRPFVHFASTAVLEQAGHHHVLDGTEFGKKMMELKDNAQKAVAQPGQFSRRAAENIFIAKAQ